MSWARTAEARRPAAPVAEPYLDGREHLRDELARLDLLLRLEIEGPRRDTAPEFNEFRGLYISADEIERLWRAEAARPAAASDLRTLRSSLATVEGRIASRIAAAESSGRRLPLPELRRLFALTVLELGALIVCLAPAVDRKYEKLFAYLQNDVTRSWPTGELILRLLCGDDEARWVERTRLRPQAPLLRHRLVVPVEEGADGSSVLSRALRAEERIVDFVLGLDLPDPELMQDFRLRRPRVSLDELVLPADLKRGLGRLLDAASASGTAAGERFVFQGAAGVGKSRVAECLAAAAGRPLAVVDLPGLVSRPGADTARLHRIFREARLHEAVVYLEGADVLLSEGAVLGPRELFDGMDGFPQTVVLGSERIWPRQLGPEALQRLDFPRPGPPERTLLWQELARREGARLAPDVDFLSLADRFDFTRHAIRRILGDARQRAAMRGGHGSPVHAADLSAACRAHCDAGLASLAAQIRPVYCWRDMVLSADRERQLREICSHLEHRRRVFGEWGFERKVVRGRGLGVLFVGPSGTGKTMAAEILAGELELDLYTIDLAAVVSKYIGETEKNLARVFSEAEQNHAILFFDEADALFGKRSEIRDAHDRYANIEINYLLQRIEEHEGTVILASNFRKNIDEAFTRRLRFVVEFPAPDEGERRQIWDRVMPEALPRHEDLDLDFMARKFQITGGAIRNIALNAAFMAAADGRRLRMEHLIRATRREFQKTGRLCVKDDFDQYFELVRAES